MKLDAGEAIPSMVIGRAVLIVPIDFDVYADLVEGGADEFPPTDDGGDPSGDREPREPILPQGEAHQALGTLGRSEYFKVIPS